MQPTLLILISFFLASSVSAQFVITPGAQVSLNGNAQLTLQNTSLVNNGSFITNNSRISFTGSANSNISGSIPVQFYELEMNKAVGNSLILQNSISVSHRILFTSGLLHLSGSNVNLGATAFLDGEDENSRITSNSGGHVIFTATLNAPASANPGNLGAIFTSAQNMGSVIISRGHESQTNAGGQGSSIRRYYSISPANNTGLNATLRIQYFDAELNGIDENAIVFFKTDDGINWIPQGFNTRNKTENWVEKTGINSFRSWTLSAAGNALPLQFISFNIKCESNKAILYWKTAQEQNTSRFDIQQSTDGIQWKVIGSIPAAGNSTTERSYSYTDNNVASNNQYRIAAYDVDGKTYYTSILRSPCSSTNVFKLWPNPFNRMVFVNIVAEASSMATLKVFDGKGSLVKEQKSAVLRGSNQLSIDLGSLPNGIYSVHAEWNNGQTKNTVQLIKQ